jgi:hypothetical protein
MAPLLVPRLIWKSCWYLVWICCSPVPRAFPTSVFSTTLAAQNTRKSQPHSADFPAVAMMRD